MGVLEYHSCIANFQGLGLLGLGVLKKGPSGILGIYGGYEISIWLFVEESSCADSKLPCCFRCATTHQALLANEFRV